MEKDAVEDSLRSVHPVVDDKKSMRTREPYISEKENKALLVERLIRHDNAASPVLALLS